MINKALAQEKLQKDNQKALISLEKKKADKTAAAAIGGVLKKPPLKKMAQPKSYTEFMRLPKTERDRIDAANKQKGKRNNWKN